MKLCAKKVGKEFRVLSTGTVKCTAAAANRNYDTTCSAGSS